jgi:NAD-dependent dihydropyrimidine dehydrogenase PreA subunit
MRQKRHIIQIDENLCDGCGQCVPACEEGAIQVINGKARLIAEKYCDGLGNCLGKCPTGALSIEEREAEPFDQEAVQEYLSNQTENQPMTGCPSAACRQFATGNNSDMNQPAQDSALSHWPVQIRLVSPEAPFFKDADLLITADCAPVASAEYHTRFLPGKVALLGCPKFDEVQNYLDTLTDILSRGDISSITVLSMEVPCCSGLLGIVRKAREVAGADIEIRNIVLSLQGQIKHEQNIAS